MRVPRYARRQIMNGNYSSGSVSNGCFSFIVLSVIMIVTLIVVGCIFSLFLDFVSRRHEHIYSDYGTSTSTCNYIGETTYWCIYHNDDRYRCNKKKVVKDSEFSKCSYSVIEKISHTIEKIEYKSQCKSCNDIIVETVYNHFGTLGNNKIYDLTSYYDISADKVRSKARFETNPYPKNLYAIVHFFDKEGNWLGYAWDRISCSNSGSDLVCIELKDDSGLPPNYHEHRWELSYVKPDGEWRTFIDK